MGISITPHIIRLATIPIGCCEKLISCKCIQLNTCWYKQCCQLTFIKHNKYLFYSHILYLTTQAWEMLISYLSETDQVALEASTSTYRRLLQDQQSGSTIQHWYAVLPPCPLSLPFSLCCSFAPFACAKHGDLHLHKGSAGRVDWSTNPTLNHWLLVSKFTCQRR